MICHMMHARWCMPPGVCHIVPNIKVVFFKKKNLKLNKYLDFPAMAGVASPISDKLDHDIYTHSRHKTDNKRKDTREGGGGAYLLTAVDMAGKRSCDAIEFCDII